MNNVDLLLLAQQRINKLKEYGLDSESIEEFKSKIKIVSEEERETLGKELFELITSKSFKDETDYEKVIELVYKGANIEYKNDTKGDFALLRCARKNYLKTFLVLIKAGANINQKNNYSTTVTMASARHGNKEMLEILILMNADINAKSKDGDNALISARNHHQVDCFYMLVNAGANLSVISQDGHSIYTFSPNEKFESQLLETTCKKEIDKPTSFDDVCSILEEAQNKMLQINPNTQQTDSSKQIDTNESSESKSVKNKYPVITPEEVRESVRTLSRLKK